MNLGQIGTNDFYPNPFVSPQAKGTGLPVGTGIRNRRAIKAQCPLSSSRPLADRPPLRVYRSPALFVSVPATVGFGESWKTQLS
jgi:hypothetical protein